MFNIKKKYKKHLLWKEILWSLAIAIIMNVAIFIIGTIILDNYTITNDFTSIYYVAIVGFLAIYVTLVAISTNLSQDFPFKISLKYIVYSRLSLSFIFLLGTNALFIHMFFLKSISNNIEQVILLVSIMFLFLSTIIFILLFMSQFRLEWQIKSFFEDMMARYSGNFVIPKITNIKNYEVIEQKDFFLFTSKMSSQERYGIEAKKISNKQLPTEKLPKQETHKKPLLVYVGKGKLQVKNWNFLKTIDIPISLKINKYEFDDNKLNFLLCEYIPLDDKKDTEKDLKNILQKNISYKDFPKEEFKEVLNKLQKNGTEEKLIILIKNYISEKNNLLERRFLFSSFEDYFKKIELNKTTVDAEEILRIEITNLYEQKELFFKSPAIIAKLQDKLTLILINAFRKIDQFSARLNTSGLYMKEFLDIRYMDSFKETQDPNWIQEYDYLITNTINNLLQLCKSIIELSMKNEFKKKYLIGQIGNLNCVLEHYKYFYETDLLDDYHEHQVDKTKKELTDKKLEIIKKQKLYLKDKQSELFYLMLYNIDKENLTKDFFEIALKISQLESFEEHYYKYERFDKLDWLSYDNFVGGVQSIARFNFNKYRLLISFYKYLNNGQIDIKKFDNENFTDISYSFEKEADNLTEKFIAKYFDFDKKKLTKFKKQILKEIKEKKESIINKKQNYIINTPLKEEYVGNFVKDCKEAWESVQKDISQFMQIEYIEGGDKFKSFFGQYILFDKEWFLDSFDKNVALSRDAGKDFGQSQGKSKLKHVLSSINRLFDTNFDKEIAIKDINTDLNGKIEANKEYYLFYNMDFKIYEIPHITWNRKGLDTAILKINNSTIHLCLSHDTENLLFEKEAFILEQYKQGFKKINEPLVVQVKTIDDGQEIKNILKNSKNLKSKEEVKQQIIIRISEKFIIKRNRDAKLIRLKIDKTKCQNQ